MTTDRARLQAARREVPSYSPQRDLPMPAYEFQTPSHTSGGISAATKQEPARAARDEVASLRNFLIR